MVYQPTLLVSNSDTKHNTNFPQYVASSYNRELSFFVIRRNENFQITNMKFLRLIYLSIFLGYVEEIIAEVVLWKEIHESPLFLIRENQTFRRAVPQKSFTSLKNELRFSYEEDKQSFVLACPPGLWTEKTKGISFLAYNFKNKIKGKHVLYEEAYNGKKQNKCPEGFRPSEVKSEVNPSSGCFFDGKIMIGSKYGVGYWIWNEETRDTEHVSIYDICYSEKGYTHYTVHTIDSFKLLQRNARYFSPDSLFNSDLKPQNQKGEEYKKYQLVPIFDLPLRTWQLATLFSFNVIQVTDEVQHYLQNVDYYIRGSIILIDLTRPVKMYSGTYTATWEELQQAYHQADDAAYERISPNKQYKFVWKIPHYHRNSKNLDYGIAFITQIEPFDECIRICENISKHSKWELFQNPAKNQCTYTCVVDENIKLKFGLTFLNITTIFPRDVPKILKTNRRTTHSPTGADHASASVPQENNTDMNSDGGGALAALLAFDVAVDMAILNDAGQSNDANDGHDGNDGGADGGMGGDGGG